MLLLKNLGVIKLLFVELNFRPKPKFVLTFFSGKHRTLKKLLNLKIPWIIGHSNIHQLFQFIVRFFSVLHSCQTAFYENLEIFCCYIVENKITELGPTLNYPHENAVNRNAKLPFCIQTFLEKTKTFGLMKGSPTIVLSLGEAPTLANPGFLI